jgi:hypothetical protein
MPSTGGTLCTEHSTSLIYLDDVRGSWTGFSFAVTDDTGNDEIRFVHHSPEGDT